MSGIYDFSFYYISILNIFIIYFKMSILIIINVLWKYKKTENLNHVCNCVRIILYHSIANRKMINNLMSEIKSISY